jgi:hypothetical protein
MKIGLEDEESCYWCVRLGYGKDGTLLLLPFTTSLRVQIPLYSNSLTLKTIVNGLNPRREYSAVNKET